MPLIERFTPGKNLYPDGASTFAVLRQIFQRMAENRDTVDSEMRAAWAAADQDVLEAAKTYTDENAGGPGPAVEAATVASDFVNSWWCQPRSLYDDLRHTFYQGGVNREGTMQVARFDLRRQTVDRADVGTFEKDDHNVPAFLVEDDKPPIVAVVRHSVEAFVRIRVGKAPHDVLSLGSAPEVQVAFPANCTYAHLIRRPGTDTVAVLTRNSDGWYKAVSTDWGQTWGAATRFHGLAYATFRMVGTRARYAVTTHPITAPNNAIRYFDIDTNTGDVTAAGSTTVIGNLWSGTTVITAASMTLVVQDYDPDTNRTFDVGRGGSIAAMRFNKTTPAAGGTYGVYRYKDGGTWTWEPIVASGVPVGYYQSGYVGGMAFGGNDNSVWLAREFSGSWALERWAKTGSTWALVDTIESRPTLQLGRPQVPWGAEGTGVFTAIEYFRYPADTFLDYYGDQVARETGITESVIDDTGIPSPELVVQGSLLLADATQWGAGVPSGTVVNLADGSTLTVNNTLAATDGAAERTTKGGLHVAISQTTASLDKRFGLASEAVRAHLAANTGHAYYVGLLGAVTRHSTAAPPDAGSHKLVGVWGSSTNDTVTVRPVTNNKVSVVPSTNRTSFAETATPAPVGTPFIVDGAVSQIPAIGTSPNVVRFGTGVTASTQNTGVSWILYAAYIEDLTVSGRTYAQARSAFQANYPTSKVAGDTWTAPATLAP